MADRRQREIREQHERHKCRNAARVEEFVVEPANAAVQEEIVMITSYHAGFTHRTVEGSCRYEFSAYVATVAVARSLGVVLKIGQFVI